MDKIKLYISSAILILIVSAFAGCGKDDIIINQKDKIYTWLTGRDVDFNEVSNGVYRVVTIPEDGEGTITIERGDSLYVVYEIYPFSSGITKSSNNVIYTNRSTVIPNGVGWSTEPLKIVAGGGSIMKGVDESLIGTMFTDSITVVMTSDNAFGDHYVQQLPPDSPIAWCVRVTKVIK